MWILLKVIKKTATYKYILKISCQSFFRASVGFGRIHELVTIA